MVENVAEDPWYYFRPKGSPGEPPDAAVAQYVLVQQAFCEAQREWRADRSILNQIRVSTSEIYFKKGKF